MIVSREARSALSKAASSFVLCVSTMASAHCEAGKRKTLAASDIIGALRDMQFGHFESPLLQFIESKSLLNYLPVICYALSCLFYLYRLPSASCSQKDHEESLY